jgi:hypothetical protein
LQKGQQQSATLAAAQKAADVLKVSEKVSGDIFMFKSINSLLCARVDELRLRFNVVFN